MEVHDFGKSWRSGLAFLALIKSVNPDLVDLRESFSREPRETIEQAFTVAHQHLDIPPLLEPEGKSLLNEASASKWSIFILKYKHENHHNLDIHLPGVERCRPPSQEL